MVVAEIFIFVFLVLFGVPELLLALLFRFSSFFVGNAQFLFCLRKIGKFPLEGGDFIEKLFHPLPPTWHEHRNVLVVSHNFCGFAVVSLRAKERDISVTTVHQKTALELLAHQFLRSSVVDGALDGGNKPDLTAVL